MLKWNPKAGQSVSYSYDETMSQTDGGKGGLRSIDDRKVVGIENGIVSCEVLQNEEFTSVNGTDTTDVDSSRKTKSAIPKTLKHKQ